jgi:hypothetical protein
VVAAAAGKDPPQYRYRSARQQAGADRLGDADAGRGLCPVLLQTSLLTEFRYD